QARQVIYCISIIANLTTEKGGVLPMASIYVERLIKRVI
ncbi:hypothetical protein MCGFDL_MCGFDL_05320, partial [Dysosmobacter welbionis]